MPSQPLVKVIITTFNRKQWAQEAIASVAAQTYRPIHILIVDDASTDGTSEMARAFASANEGLVTVVAKASNRGLADSVRAGLTTGPDTEYVAVVNDDDLWQPTFLERSIEFLRANPDVGLVHCDAQVMDGDRRPKQLRFSGLYGRFDTGDFQEVLRGNHACASTLVFSREIAHLGAMTMPDRLMVFDYYLVLLAAGYRKVGMVADPLVLYREADDGMHFAHADATWRDTTRARMLLFARNPELVTRIGGERAALREVALRTLDTAVMHLERGNWREYLWHARVIVMTKQWRPIAALARHTGAVLFRRFLTETRTVTGAV